VLIKQLGAVALLNPTTEGGTETDLVFNDGKCWFQHCWVYIVSLMGNRIVWANNGDAISRA
jgi:hypothetical protein